MPLEKDMIESVLGYCKRDLPQDFDFFLGKFDFIDDATLRNKLAQEFYNSRYMYKLMEALNLTGHELYAHVKFQIIQYASIYEAVICYLLWNKFKDNEAVKTMEVHQELRKVSALASPTVLTYDGVEAYICQNRNVKTAAPSIKFDDKVNAAVEIGFVEEIYAEEIKQFYKLRNFVHIEKASKDQFEFEIEQSRLAYRRMEPFIDHLKGFFKENSDKEQ